MKGPGPGTKVPGSERARERIGLGAKVPGSELARVLLADSLWGANWPGSEKAVTHSYVTVCRAVASELEESDLYSDCFRVLHSRCTGSQHGVAVIPETRFALFCYKLLALANLDF